MSSLIPHSIKWGVIGLGRCGANLAEEFYLRNYPVLALNSSTTDFRACRLPQEFKLHLGWKNRDGAGQDVSIGEKALENNRRIILDKIAASFEDSDNLLLTAGLGGGTGSVIPTLTQILTALDKPLHALISIPADSDGSIAKINAVRMLDRLLKSSIRSISVIDNQKLVAQTFNTSLTDIYRPGNRKIVAAFDAVNKISRNLLYKPLLGFDAEDLRKIFEHRGLLHFQSIPLSKLEISDLNLLIKLFTYSLQDGGLLASGMPLSHAACAALILILPPTLLKEMDYNLHNGFLDYVKETFISSSIFTGIFQCPENEDGNLVVVISGLPYLDRIQELLQNAKDEGKRLSLKAAASLSNLDLSNFRM